MVRTNVVHCNWSKFDINIIKNKEEGETAMHLAIEVRGEPEKKVL